MTLLVAAVLLVVVVVLRRTVVVLRVVDLGDDVLLVPCVCGGVALREIDNTANNAKTEICFMVAPVIRKFSVGKRKGGWMVQFLTFKFLDTCQQTKSPAISSMEIFTAKDTLYTSDGAYYFPRKKSRRSFDLRQLEAYSLRGILALWPEPENILQFRLGLSSMMTEALGV